MTNAQIPSLEDSEEERVRRAEELLARCTNYKGSNNEKWIPTWSSHMVKQIVEEILRVPRSKPTDVLRGLWNLLAHTHANLTEAMTEFQREIIITTLVRYRTLYDGDFSWIGNAIKQEDFTPAQAYLTLNVLKEEQLAFYKEKVLAALEKSEFLHRALHTPGIWSPDILPYGHYQIEPIELESGIVDGVFYDYWVGAKFGNVISEVHDNHERIRVLPLNGHHPAPSHWQELIQKRLDDDDEV